MQTLKSRKYGMNLDIKVLHKIIITYGIRIKMNNSSKARPSSFLLMYQQRERSSSIAIVIEYSP